MLADIFKAFSSRGTGERTALVSPLPIVPEGPLELLAYWARHARQIVVLTGAGLSAASGLHTYRGKDGRWTAETPVTWQDFQVSEEERLRQWRRSLQDELAFSAAEPNAGHRALARLAIERGAVIVTQNVDGLHRRAGTPDDRLVEIHGRGDEAACIQCGARTPLSTHREYVEGGSAPRCPTDGAPLQPAVVLFGQRPAHRDLTKAEAAARSCDLFLVVGSSLSVTPAAFLPIDAHHSGAKVVFVNKGAPSRDPKADLVFDADAVEVLAAAFG